MGEISLNLNENRGYLTKVMDRPCGLFKYPGSIPRLDIRDLEDQRLYDGFYLVFGKAADFESEQTAGWCLPNKLAEGDEISALAGDGLRESGQLPTLFRDLRGNTHTRFSSAH